MSQKCAVPWPAMLLGAAAAVVVALPHAARAQWRGGFYFGIAPPAYYAPPVYYPPRVYYPPPAVYYPPPPTYYTPPPVTYSPPPPAPAPGQQCYTPATVCPMERPSVPGNSCWCTTASGRAYGQVR